MSFSITTKLEPKIYELVDMDVGDIKQSIFQAIKDRFEVPKKIYGEYEDTVNHMFSYYLVSGMNMGCLLHGEAGAGKSLTAELLCNKAIDYGMPVLYIRSVGGVTNKYVEKYISILKTLRNTCIFIDEFGKIFDLLAQTKFLSILTDLSANNLWILTENNERSISPFISRRPGRVRYNIEYNKISERAVTEYCQDNPIPQNIYMDLMEKYHSTDLFTFDQLKALVSEIQFCLAQYGKITSIDDICKMLNVKDVLTTYLLKPSKIFYQGEDLAKSDPRYGSVAVFMSYSKNRIWDEKSIPVTMREMDRLLGGPSKELKVDIAIEGSAIQNFSKSKDGATDNPIERHVASTGRMKYSESISSLTVVSEFIDGSNKRFICATNDFFKIIFSVFNKNGEEIFFE